MCSELICSYVLAPSRQWRRSGVFIVNSEHISHLVLVFLLLIFYRYLSQKQLKKFKSKTNLVKGASTLVTMILKLSSLPAHFKCSSLKILCVLSRNSNLIALPWTVGKGVQVVSYFPAIEIACLNLLKTGW